MSDTMTSDNDASRKFSLENLAEVFAGKHRLKAGKIELTCEEIADILNGEILPPETTITRQAVDNRLGDVLGTQFHESLGGRLIRTQHGRSYMYPRDTDLVKVFSTGDTSANDDLDMAIISFIFTQPGQFAGTAEVADEIDLTTNGASYRLRQLREQGVLRSRNVSRDEIWYPSYRD